MYMYLLIFVYVYRLFLGNFDFCLFMISIIFRKFAKNNGLYHKKTNDRQR